MTSFVIKLILAVVLFFVARYLAKMIKDRKSGTSDQSEGGSERSFPRRRDSSDLSTGLLGLLKSVAYSLSGILAVWAFAGTSVVWVPSGQFATLKRVYLANSLPAGRIVALEGELGPQAEIITAGFHFKPFITLINEVDTDNKVFTVPNGKCAIMSARDGVFAPGGQAFAEPWPDNVKMAMINDAVYFLTQGPNGGNGQRGPQTSVLTPGAYTINPFLWEEPRLIDAVRVEQGTVGVIKSSVLAAVDFGSFRRARPTSMDLQVLTAARLPNAAATVLLVPVGAIGVWEQPLSNGLYYINTDAYKITMVPTTAQVYEYKGGYTRRTVEIWLDDQGKITEKQSSAEVQLVKEAADGAIFTKPEGWDVPQELRVLVQTSPELAPFVVASLGLTQANAGQVIEDRVVTPIIRSVVRDVNGGTQIPFVQTRAVLDAQGNPQLNAQGETLTQIVREFRAVKVMDLIENRSSLEDAMEGRARPETLKEGVTTLEIRLGESAIPPELLLARKREQLAQQLTKALAQEQLTQVQRQKTENARAQASQQETLVKADIESQAAEKNRQARLTQGEGEKGYLLAIAEGQRVQSQVLGQDQTVRLQMFGSILKMVTDISDKHPEIITASLTNASKFVPNVVVNNSGGGSGSSGGSMEGAAAVFAQLMNPSALVPTARPQQPVATPVSATK